MTESNTYATAETLATLPDGNGGFTVAIKDS